MRTAIYTALVANLFGEQRDADVEKASCYIEYDIYKNSKSSFTYQHKVSQKVFFKLFITVFTKRFSLRH